MNAGKLHCYCSRRIKSAPATGAWYYPGKVVLPIRTVLPILL